MKKKTLRIISAFLAVVLVFLMIPIGSISVFAANVTTLTEHDDWELLGMGYNLLGDSRLSSGAVLESSPIFNSSVVNYVTSKKTTGTESSYSYTYIKNMDSYLKKQSSSISTEIGASGKIKMVSLGVKESMGLEQSSGTSSETMYEYAVLKALHKTSTYYMDISSRAKLYSLWSNNVINSDFIESAYDIGAGTSAAQFASMYGTHILVGYAEGGEATVTYSGSSLSKAFSESTKTETEISASAGVSGLVSVEGKIKKEYAVDESGTSGSTDISVYGKAYGASSVMNGSFNSGGFDADTVDSFFASITDATADIIVDKSLRLLPVWELLIASQNETLVAAGIALKNYYDTSIDAQCEEFYSEYINSAYDAEDIVDEVDEWTMFDDTKIISTAEDFNNIRNDLNGTYVLACNIDLSEYENWTPIGTADAPFMGTLYGNYNTVRGLNITEVNTGYAGLFGYNYGTVKDLTVSGTVKVENSVETCYIGGVTGYNHGTVANCTDLVKHDFSAFPVYTYNLNSSSTITVENTLGVRLRGEPGMTYHGINIVVGNNNTTPVYIILENANIVGTSTLGAIYHEGSCPIYLVSEGEANSIAGAAESVAVNVAKSSISILGDAELKITGGYGGNGGQGTQGVQGSDGSSGEAGHTGFQGGTGGVGRDGKEGVVASHINVFATDVTVTGGRGGNGGQGGTGGKGGNGADATFGLGSSHNAKDGGRGGVGGYGGAGGRGGDAIVSTATVCVYSSGDIRLVGGAGGNGGKGGTGGAGGAGGDKIFGDYASDGPQGYRGIGGTNGLPGSNVELDIKVTGGATVYVYNNGYGQVGNAGDGNGAMIDYGYVGTFTWNHSGGTSSCYFNMYAPFRASEVFEPVITQAKVITYTDIYTICESYYIVYETSAKEGNYVLVEAKQISFGDAVADIPAHESIADIDTAQKQTMISTVVELSGRNNTAFWTRNNSGDASAKYGYIKENNLAKRVQTNIEITSVTKTDYFSSDSFDRDTVAIFVDGARVYDYEVVFNPYCSDYISERTGYVKIIRDDCERYIPVHITRTAPVSIEIAQTGKTEFVKGTEFDISGLSLAVNYNNGDIKYITEQAEGISYTVPSLEFAGMTLPVVVSYDHDSDESTPALTASYDIHTVKLQVSGIAINDAKVSYKQGDSLDTDSIEIVVFKNDGSKTILADYTDVDFDVNPSMCNVGTSTVTVTYEGCTAEFTITVSAKDGFDHAWGDGVITTAPTHISSGVMTYTCKVDNCDATKTENIKPIEGHDFGEWVKYSDTQHMHSCECGEIEYEDHTWNDGVETLAPTYTEEGIITFTCTVCFGEKIEIIPPIGIEDAPQIIVNSVQTMAGQTVTVNIALDNNTGILAAALTVTYDDALTLIDAERGDALSTLSFTKPGVFASPCTFAWDGADGADTANGTVLSLTFLIPEDAVTGDTYDISVSYEAGNVVDGDLEKVELVTIGGGVTVIDHIPGDLSGDGVVNMADVVSLRRYIVGGYNLDINVEAADVNNDGNINMTDVVLIRRYIVGGYGVELK